MTRHLLSVGIMLPPGLTDDVAVSIAAMTGRLGFATVHLADVPTPGLLARLIETAAPALVVVNTDEARGLVRVNDPETVAAVRARLDAAESTCPLQVSVPISIGRTMNEAFARADLEPRFSGDRHPRDVGIFGTFEQAQEQVLALARAGADDLVLDVPLERDIADVLAQIRALVVGATPELLDAPPRKDRAEPPRTVFYGN
ncbi:hypothetical protein [Nocardioides gilvus]|uniref:hypothetical protein n=1 Tax=Nocardioides gilvus TaxID=1735589 RepID=UPI000D745545|nr:hypothetical protein [Nocardioides gilvus]